MSTHSYIGYLRGDGKVLYSYCHWDGYLSHNGLMLNTFYRSKQNVQKLMILGDISALGVNLEPPRPIRNETEFNEMPEILGMHYKESFVLAYSRDRHETDCGPYVCTEEEYGKSIVESYVYLYKKGHWYLCYNGKQYKLDEILKDENKFREYEKETGEYENFVDIQREEVCIKENFMTKTTEMYTVLLQYSINSSLNNLEVGYSYVNNKRVYAIYERNPNRKNRKLVVKGENIYDLFVALKEKMNYKGTLMSMLN